MNIKRKFAYGLENTFEPHIVKFATVKERNMWVNERPGMRSKIAKKDVAASDYTCTDFSTRKI